MRKYYKLALVVVTVVSLVCFVFYKTQYDRLYNVLQVLEFFGGDGVGVGVGVGRGSPDALSCSHAAWSPPSFRALGPDVQVYSAFCAGGDECDVVVVNALVRGDPAAAARCRLWLEGGRGGPVAAESVSLVDVPFSTLSARPPPPPASASSFHAAGIACRCQDGRGGGGGSSKTPYAVSLSIGEREWDRSYDPVTYFFYALGVFQMRSTCGWRTLSPTPPTNRWKKAAAASSAAAATVAAAAG